MQSKKSVKSEEESLERKILEICNLGDDCVGLKELCPFQDQGVIEVHCRSDCAWYSEDQCCIWDLIQALRGIRIALETR